MSNKQEKQDNENYSKNFTRIPNIVFASYTKLTKEEKFLYCTLRQVYWDMKPRFVSLRELSEVTGYAIGALSKMLPRLHKCGLIHSEIRHEKGKDGKAKGHAKYHVTIPDIWELNRKYFEASPEEQVAMDPSLELANVSVHQMNSPKDCSRNDTEVFTKCDSSVHQMNVSVPFGEQSQARVELTKDSIKDTSKDIRERKKDAGQQKPNISTPETSFSPSFSSQSSFSEEKEPKEIVFTEKQMVVYNLAQERKYSRLKKDTKHQIHCEALAEAGVITGEKMDSLEKFCREKLSYKGPIDLCLGNLASELNGWLQVQRLTQKKTSSGTKQIWEMTLAERNAYYKDRYGMPALASKASTSVMVEDTEQEVTDEDLAEDVRKIVHAFQEDDRFETYLQSIEHFKAQFGLTNYKVYTRMIEARKKASPENSSMDDFIHALQKLMY